jgi:hypothetical protein
VREREREGERERDLTLYCSSSRSLTCLSVYLCVSISLIVCVLPNHALLLLLFLLHLLLPTLLSFSEHPLTRTESLTESLGYTFKSKSMIPSLVDKQTVICSLLEFCFSLTFNLNFYSFSYHRVGDIQTGHHSFAAAAATAAATTLILFLLLLPQF